jgi:predicted dehydrogenase
MTFKLCVVGAGQFSAHFASLFHLHPLVSEVYVTDLIPSRATGLAEELGLVGTFRTWTRR